MEHVLDELYYSLKIKYVIDELTCDGFRIEKGYSSQRFHMLFDVQRADQAGRREKGKNMDVGAVTFRLMYSTSYDL
jgi:hypothetical protein